MDMLLHCENHDAHRFILLVMQLVWVSAGLHGAYQGLTPTPGSDAHDPETRFLLLLMQFGCLQICVGYTRV